MNIAIEQTEEYVNGQLKNKYGDAFLRGNNGKFLSFVSATAILKAIHVSFSCSSLDKVIQPFRKEYSLVLHSH